jgi:DNA-binding response OmpR family regulator
MTKSFDPSGLSALVIDRTHGQRLITLEQLRLMGFGAVAGASSAAQGWEALLVQKPHIVLLDWLEPGEDTLDFVRRARRSEENPNRAVLMFMLTSRGSLGDVERARQAGVDGYLRKPISVAAIEERVKHVVVRPQSFITTDTYVGPCRRRRQDPDYAGPWKRAGDAEMNAERVRVAAAAVEAAARGFDGDTLPLHTATRALRDLAGLTGDAHIGFGARELMRYIDARSADFALDAEVIRTHSAALTQLALLPPTLDAERARMAESLKRMVDKKLLRA